MFKQRGNANKPLGFSVMPSNYIVNLKCAKLFSMTQGSIS